MDTLPWDLIELIWSQPNGILKMRVVCRAWRNVCDAHAEEWIDPVPLFLRDTSSAPIDWIRSVLDESLLCKIPRKLVKADKFDDYIYFCHHFSWARAAPWAVSDIKFAADNGACFIFAGILFGRRFTCPDIKTIIYGWDDLAVADTIDILCKYHDKILVDTPSCGNILETIIHNNIDCQICELIQPSARAIISSLGKYPAKLFCNPRIRFVEYYAKKFGKISAGDANSIIKEINHYEILPFISYLVDSVDDKSALVTSNLTISLFLGIRYQKI